MKMNIDIDVGIDDVSNSIINELNSSRANHVIKAAEELMRSSSGDQFLNLYTALANQLNCEWDPEVPDSVTDARLELVQAAQDIIDREELLQENLAAEEEEEEEEEDETDHEDQDVRRIRHQIEARAKSAGENLELNDEGILALSGYRVGRTAGLPTSERRDCIRAAFSSRLPRTHEDDKYGQPNSYERKQHLISVMHFLVRRAEHRRDTYGHDMSRAIREWNQDLAWIRDYL